MLQRLVLRDFVLVDALDLEFHTGFGALTGETGAGKSILLDALQWVLGARGDATLIREGCSRAEISAEFTDLSPALIERLEQDGFDTAEPLLLRRSIDTQGRSRAWIAGSAATLTQLRLLGEELVEIHGQHAWQSLTRPGSVRALLDAYAGIDTTSLARHWIFWREARQQLESARHRSADLERERERLAWQIGEIERLEPGENEWAELQAEHQRLAHTQSILDSLHAALQALSEAELNASGLTSRALDALSEAGRYDPSLDGTAGVLRDAQAQLDDAAHTLHATLRRTELDPDRLAELDSRMSAWMGLARRFRRPPQELYATLTGWRAELAALDSATDLDALSAAADRAQAAFMAEAGRVSTQRRQHAPQLSAQITAAMQQLGMAGGRFEVALETLPEPQSGGLEAVDFLVAGHAGSTPRPLAKVASGGELSRIALAIAVTTSQLGGADTLIFDEVDAGVGGAIAETVGRLMFQLGRDQQRPRQVLAVTHLAQVAAWADHHWVVSKHSDDAGTRSSVRSLAPPQRVEEVSRMLGGKAGSEVSLAHARALLEGIASEQFPRERAER